MRHEQTECVDTYEGDAEGVCESFGFAESDPQTCVAAWSHGHGNGIRLHVVAAQMLHAVVQETAKAGGVVVALPFLEVLEYEAVR